MALCTFANNYTMYDITPVENIFIQEFMLKAPGDFVKVYLYGLKQCYHPEQCEDALESFSKSLGLDESLVEDAFVYWERQGILKKKENSPLAFEYYNLKEILHNKGYSNSHPLYQYRDFNQNLQMIFGTRLLQSQDYQKIYDWIEVMKLPQEVALMLVQHCIGLKGNQVSINYIDKVAIGWAKDGIHSISEAEEYIKKKEMNQSGTVKVLNQLGIYRTPSVDEVKLIKKWRDTYGFSLDAILYACRETTKIQSPNMGYLDKILESYYKMNLLTARAIQEHLEGRNSNNIPVREVLFELGTKEVSPTPELVAMYQRWTGHWGFSHSVILLATRQTGRKGGKTFEAVENVLQYWLEKGLKSQEDIDQYLQNITQINIEVRAILERFGDSRPVTVVDRKFFRIWMEDLKMSFEMILQAAEYSILAENKIQFMNRILDNWHKNGILTLSAAQEEHNRHKGDHTKQTPPAKQLKKDLDFHKFDQRQYTDEDFESLFEDIENG